VNSSKRLLKDRPTQADPQIPNSTTAVGLPSSPAHMAGCSLFVTHPSSWCSF
jgi:hypothetical protein